MKKLLAIVLVVSLFLTGVGFVPVAYAAEEDGLIAAWTNKENLILADREILLQPQEGTLGEDTQVQLPEVKSSRYQKNDIVTVIVELEDAPLLACANEAGLELQTYGATGQGIAQAQALEDSHASVKAKIRALHGSAGTQSVNGASSLEYDYTAALNGFSIRIPYGDLEAVREMKEVKVAFVAEQYALPDTGRETESTISMASSSGMVGATEANELGYDGAGTVVAVLDTGMDTDHEAFSVMPTEAKYTREDIQKLLEKGLACGMTTADEVYVSEKIPFGFDYAEGDASTEADIDHGVHVAGTVAGNNGEDFFGVAPNAQLLVMKVFSDGSGSTSDDIILAGLDDAVKLGADAANLSLGSPAGFAEYNDDPSQEVDGYLTYSGVYTRAKEAGINVLVASGNETSSTYHNPYGNNLTLTQYPDNGIVGSPGSLSIPVTVASVDNAAYMTQRFLLGDTYVPYHNAADYNTQTSLDFLDTFEGRTVEYVTVPGLGERADFEGLDLTGKLAVITRGAITFDEKAANAAEAGAIGVIIYNNEDGSLITPALTNLTVPVIGVSKEAGQLLKDAEDKRVSFSAGYYGAAPSPDAYQVSSFSSQGPAPDLSIKPEISAPGGNITSSVIGGGYDSYSGTSMATPHMAGLSAIARQYVKEQYGLEGEALVDCVTNLLMSTAIPTVDNDSGTCFSVRLQGAGVANVYNAIQSGAYLTVDGGRPKAEVGSNEDGVYDYTVTVTNMTQSPKTYTLDTAVLVETVTGLEGTELTFAANEEKALTAQEVQVSYTGAQDGSVTVPAEGTASFTVTVSLTAAGKRYLEENFENGTYVEGFTFLYAGEEDGIDLSLPFLGFYGDWANLDVFDADLGRDVNMAGTILGDVDNTGYGYYMGYNAVTGSYDASKMSFGPRKGNRQLVSQICLLRNVTSLTQSITDDEGNVLWSTGDLGRCRKTYYNASAGGYTAVLYNPGWNGRLSGEGDTEGALNSGPWAESNQYYYFNIEATPAAGGEPQKLSYRFYLDDTRPQVSQPQLYEKDGSIYLTLTVSDNYYLQRIRILDSTQQYWYLSTTDEFDSVTQPGQEVSVTLDVTGLAQKLALSGKNPGRIGVLVEDYAHNEVLTFVDIGPQSLTLTSAHVEVGGQVQIQASIKPDRMADTVLQWASQDESIATVDETGVVTGVADGVVEISATATSGLTAYALVTVGQGVPVRLCYGEAPELNDRFQSGDFWYKVTGPDEVQLTKEPGSDWSGYSQLSGSVEIPASVTYNEKTFSVTSIGYGAFSNMDITSVVIPNTVKVIGESAFSSCTSLESVTMPDSVEQIDRWAFYSVPAEIPIPKNLKTIGEEAFYFSGVTVADLPEGLETIGDSAFFSCTELTKVTIPRSVAAFGKNIFYGCGSLSYASLPNNLEEIPEGMFWNCTDLTRIQIPESVAKIGYAAFYGSGLEQVILPEKLQEIDDWAFAWLTNTREITIPDSVESIGMNAFIYAEGVDTVNIGSGVKTIGQDAFYLWGNNHGVHTTVNVKTEDAAVALRRSGFGHEILLNGVPFTGYSGIQFNDGIFTYMPISDDSVQIIAFNDETGDEEIVVPETAYCEGDDKTYTVTSIKTRVFFQNLSLRKLTLPDTITDIGERAFDQMFNISSINIPKSLETVEAHGLAYLGWDASTGFSWDVDTLEIPGTMKNWGESAFSGDRYTEIVVGEGVTSIGRYGLSNQVNATSVTLPSTLERIESFAFMECQSLTSIDLPDGVTYIGEGAFNNTPLESIHLPEALTYLGGTALSGYAWDENYNEVPVGPTYVELNGKLRDIGWYAFRSNAQIVAVLNSQKNTAVAFHDLETLPTVCWDGKTDIPYNDGSCVPEGKTVTVTKDVTIDGKLCIEGKLVVAPNVNLIVTENARIEGAENIEYKTCDGGEGCFSKTFTDLNTKAWYHAYTDYVIARGLMNGMSATRFAPDAQLTRGMLVTTLYRLAGEPEVTEAATFTDVAADKYYTDAIAWAEDQGIAQGMGGGKFAPNGAVTREQGMTFLYRYVVSVLGEEPGKNGDLSIFRDAGKISNYAKEAMAWGAAAGLLEGYGDGTVGPKNSVTRAQMAKFLTILSKAF